MELVEAGRHRVAVQVAGGNDPPVVLVSAMGEPGSAWQPVTEQLTTGSQVVTYDRPGIGASPPRGAPNRPLPYSAFAAELADLADTVGITAPMVAVGHSLGSLIVRMLAADYPERVAGMVHVDGSVPRLILWPGADPTTDGDGPDATEVDAAAGLEEMSRARLLQVPTVVVARTPGRWHTPPPDPSIDDVWQRAQADLARQTDGTLIIAADAGHRIPREAPGLVAFAIDQVVRAVRGRITTVTLDPEQAERAGGKPADR